MTAMKSIIYTHQIVDANESLFARKMWRVICVRVWRSGGACWRPSGDTDATRRQLGHTGQHSPPTALQPPPTPTPTPATRDPDHQVHSLHRRTHSGVAHMHAHVACNPLRSTC